MIGIYSITSPSNKVYIGQSWDIAGRKKYYKNKKAYQQPGLSNSFKKYGFDSHEIKVLHELPIDVEQEVLDRYEQFYMDTFRGAGIVLLNIKEGGRGGKHSDESKNKMAEWQLGRKKSDSHKSNISAAQFGRKNSTERIANMVSAKTANPNTTYGKPIIQFSKAGSFVKKWANSKTAALAIGVSNVAISRHLKGLSKTCAGFLWKYA